MRENHILIIDDDLMLLKTAEEILSDQYNVQCREEWNTGIKSVK